jgi:Fe2+ or Zn2+ uptake regulation protein
MNSIQVKEAMNDFTLDDAAGGHSRTQLAAELESTRRELARVKHGAVNSDFVQLSKIYMDETVSLANHAPAAFMVLMTLVKQMNKANSVMISNESLERICGVSNSTIKRAIKILREQQWIDVLKVGTSNVYRVNSNVFWQDRADGKWASFQAQVVLNFDEQDETTKKKPVKSWTRHIPLVEADDANRQPPEQAAQAELGI